MNALERRALAALADGTERTGIALVRDHGLPRATLYVALWQLELAGLVTSRLESLDESQLPRYAYRITEAGRRRTAAQGGAA